MIDPMAIAFETVEDGDSDEVDNEVDNEVGITSMNSQLPFTNLEI